MAYTCNPSPWEADVGKSYESLGLARGHRVKPCLYGEKDGDVVQLLEDFPNVL